MRQSPLAQQQTRISLNAPPQVGAAARELSPSPMSADLKSHADERERRQCCFATQAEAYQRQQELIAQQPGARRANPGRLAISS